MWHFLGGFSDRCLIYTKDPLFVSPHQTFLAIFEPSDMINFFNFLDFEKNVTFVNLNHNTLKRISKFYATLNHT